MSLDTPTSEPRHAQTATFDMLIVGGGMVGATLACAMANTGLRIGIVDQNPMARPALATQISDSFDPRVSAISPASQCIFEKIGVWDQLQRKRHCPYTDMQVWEADGTASIRFSAAAIHAEELGYIFENSVLLAALHEHLHNADNIEWIAPGTPSSLVLNDSAASPLERVSLVLADGRQIRTQLLIGADGANSRVRELARFVVREWDYEHHAIVTTVRTERGHCRTALQRFMDKGILAFLPLSDEQSVTDQHHCSIVWSVVPELAAQLLGMNDQEFTAALQGAIENRLGAIEWVGVRHSFPLRQRHAVTYVKDNLALIGDAAHSIHPLAGLGVNLGLLDAWALAEQLQKALQRGQDIGALRILQRYQRERVGHNLGMMGLMEGFKRLYADQPLLLRWLRNVGMRGLDELPAVKNRIMREAMGIGRII